VTKYPLLLSRLYKVTPYQHEDRNTIKLSQERIEAALEQMNKVRYSMTLDIEVLILGLILTTSESSMVGVGRGWGLFFHFEKCGTCLK